MPEVLHMILSALLLVSALVTDAFVASLGYGAGKIKIPLRSAVIISVVSSLLLFIALYLGSFLGSLISAQTARIVCCVILCLIGFIKLFDGLIKGYIRRHQNIQKNIRFSLFSLKFILTIYADPEKADGDSSKELSIKEAVSLSVALSLDSLSVGIGAGMGEGGFVLITALSLIMNFGVILLGAFLGRKLAKKSNINLSWLSGAILIALAFIKLYF